MDLKLNIYDNKNNIIKSYEANQKCLSVKVTRQIMQYIDIDSILAKSDNLAAGAELLKLMQKLEPYYLSILNCVFPDLTAEELDNCQMNDVSSVIMQILTYTISNLFLIQDKTKN